MTNQKDNRMERYEIEGILGEGGTGVVYLAKDNRLGRLVAVKMLQQVTVHFKEEVAMLQKQNTRMLPAIFDAWTEDNKTGVIVMEYVEGQNLKEYLSLHQQISEKQIFEWGLQLGEFLKQLHNGKFKMLYRDLKIENIIVQLDKTLRFVDVGAAVMLEEEELYRNKRVGTLGYAAPEQWEGKRVDERTDIYGLGAVLYAVTEGEEKLKNFAASDNVAEKSKGHTGMTRVIRRCMSRKQNDRYPTAEAFLADWKRYKRLGKGEGLMKRIFFVLRYALLYAAVYVIWYQSESLFWYTHWGNVKADYMRFEDFSPLLGSFLFGYLWVKMAEWILWKRNEKWEQKKSIWRSGCGIA